MLNVRLFDIGDSSQPGTITIKPPADSNLSSFTGCVGSGPTTGTLSNCSITGKLELQRQVATDVRPDPDRLHLRLHGGHGLLGDAVVQLRRRPAVGHDVLDGEPRGDAGPAHRVSPRVRRISVERRKNLAVRFEHRVKPVSNYFHDNPLPGTAAH